MAQLSFGEVKFQDVIDAALKSKNEIKVLEAGCGSVCHVNFKQNKYIVGIDISEKQLIRNNCLNEKIMGDIQYYVFPPMSFDVIVCWDVFEHLREPEKALEKFVYCTKKAGIIILHLPNALSLKGLVTKYTPHWFHVLWYKYVYGRKEAGKEDIGPFKTYLKKTITPNSLKQFAAHNGLDIIFYENYEATFLRSRNIFAYCVYRIIRAIVSAVSLGKLGNSEILMILKKQG